MDMNPSSYENLDNVDWAALAQQWIQMQDDVLPPPAAPPPPIFTAPAGAFTRQIYEEKGEADMDMGEAPAHNYCFPDLFLDVDFESPLLQTTTTSRSMRHPLTPPSPLLGPGPIIIRIHLIFIIIITCYQCHGTGHHHRHR